MDPAAEERAQASQALLRLLLGTTDPSQGRWLAQALYTIDPPAEERAQALKVLLGLLARAEPQELTELISEISGLAVTAESRAEALVVLLRQLDRTTDSFMTQELARAVPGLAVTGADRAQARQALLGKRRQYPVE